MDLFHCKHLKSLHRSWPCGMREAFAIQSLNFLLLFTKFNYHPWENPEVEHRSEINESKAKSGIPGWMFNANHLSQATPPTVNGHMCSLNSYELDELGLGSPRTQWAVKPRAERGREKEKEERKKRPKQQTARGTTRRTHGKKTKKERQRRNRDGCAHRATATKEERTERKK